MLIKIATTATLISSIILWMEQIADTPWLSQAEHLTLTGALMVAVAILWKSLDKKDNLIIRSTEITTTALNASTNSNIELRRIIEEHTRTQQAVKDILGRVELSVDKLPCNTDDIQCKYDVDNPSKVRGGR